MSTLILSSELSYNSELSGYSSIDSQKAKVPYLYDDGAQEEFGITNIQLLVYSISLLKIILSYDTVAW